jgi:predicted MPP superfamily phosphohydrolase
MKLNKKIKALLIVIGLGLAFFLYCYLETYWIKTNEIEISSADIPSAFNETKIVFISDIHHGPYFSIERVRSLVSKINALNPDIVILGGDYSHREPKYIEPFFDELLKIKSKHGVFGVLGNHDHWEDAQLTKAMMERNGIKLCDNKSYWVNIGQDSIKIGGVGDLWEDEQILENTTWDVNKNNF